MLKQAEKRILSLIAAGYALVILLVVALAYSEISGMNVLHNLSHNIINHPFRVNAAAVGAKGSATLIRDKMLLIELSGEPKQVEQLASEMPPLVKELRNQLDIIKANFLGDMSRVEEAEVLMNQWQVIRNREIDVSMHGRRGVAYRIAKRSNAELFTRLNDDLNYVADFSRQRAATFLTESENETTNLINSTLWFVAALIIAISFIGWYVGHRLLMILRLGEQLEKAVQASELEKRNAMYSRSLIEASLDPVVTISPEGKITDVNRATEEATGRSRSELIGTDFSDYFTEPDKAREVYQQVFANSAVTDYPLSLHHRDGHFTDVRYNASVYRDEAGEVLGVFAAARDVTELKQAEDKIIELNRDLEQRVADRTGQLEAANNELESFSYSVSHDLRTPLRAIDGFSHILLDDYTDKLDDEGKRLLRVVRDNTQKMGQLIDDILAFSRTGRVGLSCTDIDMERMAHTVVDELQLDGARQQVEIEPLPPAQGDSAMMHQVFVNLLSNAIKFSRYRENAKITVGGSIVENEAVYYVKDNGAGFDMKYADKLFGVFQRLHAPSEFEGTGIGLAIIKRIITRHGGRVWAEGRVNEGATIYFALPAKVSSAKGTAADGGNK